MRDKCGMSSLGLACMMTNQIPVHVSYGKSRFTTFKS